MDLEDGKLGRGTSSPCSSYAPISLALRPLTCDVNLDACRVFLYEQYPTFLMQEILDVFVFTV